MRIALLLCLALSGGSVAVLALRRPAPPPPTPALEALAAFREEGGRRRATLATLVEQRRWEEVEEEARALAGLDPLSAEARAALQLAPQEKAVGARVEAAARAEELGHDAEALDGFLGVPRTSAYHAQARAQVQELSGRVAAQLRGDCLGLPPRDPRARASCRRYLDLTCHVRRDEDVERRVGRGTWTCPAELAHWFAGGSDASAELIAAVRRVFGEGEIAEAVLQHAAQGRTRAALERLQAVRGDPRAPALAAQLQRIDARLQDGRAALLAGRLRDAGTAWGEAFAADARLMPAGFAAVHVAAARRELGQAFREEGGRLLSQKQLRPAAQAIASGLAADPGSIELHELRSRLEAEAAARADGAGCAELREIAPLLPGAARAGAEARLAACP